MKKIALALVTFILIASISVPSHAIGMMIVQPGKNSSYSEFMRDRYGVTPKEPPSVGSLISDFMGTTVGGEIRSGILDSVEKSIEKKYITPIFDSAKATSKQAKQVRDQIRSLNKKIQGAKGNDLKVFTAQKDGLNRGLNNLKKAAHTTNKLGGTLKNISSIGFYGVGAYFTIDGIKSDVESYNKVKHKDHAYLDFMGRTLKGMNIMVSGASLHPAAKPLAIPGLAIGIAKDIVDSDFMVEVSKNPIVSFGLKPYDWFFETGNTIFQKGFEFLISGMVDDYEYDVVARKQFASERLRWRLIANRINVRGAGVYKPNIYIYPEAECEVSVVFDRPELLTRTIPDYESGWQATVKPDGTVTAYGEEYGFLFYESIAFIDKLSFEEGFVITPDNRREQLETLISSYGFNEQETCDFVDFWDEKLEKDVQYAAYPLLTDIVDELMPVNIDPLPENIGRLWFAFEENGEPETEAVAVPFEREGYSVLEWGGLFIN